VNLKRGRAFADLVNTYAPSPFANGHVPTGPAYPLPSGPPSTGFLDDLVKIFPEFAEDAKSMKWGSTEYVIAFPIFFRAQVMPERIGVGIITARAGDGQLTQEWIFGSTNGDPLEAYYNPKPGFSHGPSGHAINELAARALVTGDLGAGRTPIGGKPRLADHWPTPESIAEP